MSSDVHSWSPASQLALTCSSLSSVRTCLPSLTSAATSKISAAPNSSRNQVSTRGQTARQVTGLELSTSITKTLPLTDTEMWFEAAGLIACLILSKKLACGLCKLLLLAHDVELDVLPHLLGREQDALADGGLHVEEEEGVDAVRELERTLDLESPRKSLVDLQMSASPALPCLAASPLTALQLCCCLCKVGRVKKSFDVGQLARRSCSNSSGGLLSSLNMSWMPSMIRAKEQGAGCARCWGGEDS
eukprot:753441-Hanusia_phi.AAC.1